MGFPQGRIYLDWAAAAPVLPKAERAFLAALRCFGNPSSPHEEGRAAHTILTEARTRIARLAGVKTDAVIFTSGATEANALGILGHVQALIARGVEASAIHILYLSTSHASVQGAVAGAEALGARVEALPLTEGSIDLTKLASAIRPETALVVMDVVCGETGTLYPVRAIRRVLDKAGNGRHIVLHADASQAPLVESFELTHLGADMVTLDAQKVGGVRGIGALIVQGRVALSPLILGGGQERGLRPGTETPALAHAFAVALEAAVHERPAFISRAEALRADILSRISGVPDLVVNEGKVQAPHILNVSLIGRDTDYLAALLDAKGFAVSTKSACETDEEGSRVVYAMTNDTARAQATLRISWGPSIPQRHLRRLAAALVSTVRFLDQNTV